MPWLPHEIWASRRMGDLAPGAAADAAIRVFCTPTISERRHPKHRLLAERARFHLRHARRERLPTPFGELQIYVFTPDEAEPRGTVVMIHGWTGEASFMTALAEPVRRAGHRVVLVDLPAHGLSAGRSTNLMDCARALAHLGQHLGPITAVVTHSFGSMVALVAAEGLPPMPSALDSAGFVFVCSPNRLTDITRGFSEHWELPKGGLAAFEHRLERIGRRPIGCFTVERLLRAVGRPALLIHAKDDGDVPFSCSEEIAARVPGTELLLFDGMGHRDILFVPRVARTVVSYIEQRIVPVSDTPGQTPRRDLLCGV